MNPLPPINPDAAAGPNLESAADVMKQQVFEQVETQQYQLVLPAEFEELRGYLENDGLLSDEEITKCLYDESLRQKDLAKLVADKTPAADKPEHDKLTTYLWDVHQSVKGLPLGFVDPKQTYRIDVVDTGPSVSSQPQVAQPTTPPDQSVTAPDQRFVGSPKVSPVTLHLDINGGFLANFLHNARLNHQQMNRFITDLEQQHRELTARVAPGQSIQKSPDSPPARTVTPAPPDSLLLASDPTLTPWQRLRQTVSDWIAPTIPPGPPAAPPIQTVPGLDGTANRPGEQPPTVSSVAEPTGVSAPDIPITGNQVAHTVSLTNTSGQSEPVTLTTAGVSMPPAPQAIASQHTEEIHMKETRTPGAAVSGPAQEENQMTNRPTRYQWPEVAPQFEKLGITRQELERAGQLTDLLNGRKTGLMNLTQIGENDKPFQISGKLYIVNTPDKGPIIGIQPERKQLLLPSQFLGYEFTDRDKQNLEKRGEMGKRVDLTDKVTGKTFAGYVGVDPETRSLTVLRAERLRVPQTIKGVTLTKPQQKNLEQGRAIRLEGMTSNNGHTFDAYVQVSAAKRSLTFAKIPDNAVKQTVDQKTAQDLAKPAHQLNRDKAGVAPDSGKKTVLPKPERQPDATKQAVAKQAAAPKPAKQQKMTAPKPTLGESKPRKPKKQKGQSL